MSVEIVQKRLAAYACRSTLEEEQALREITQETMLAGLGRTDLFGRTGLQGGTCLRIFHSLNRFSEDMDFALEAADPTFQLSPYLDRLDQELTVYGYELEIDDRSKADAPVRKAFVKDDSVGKLLSLDYRPRTGPLRKLRIKLEVDTNPPLGASYDMQVLDFPETGRWSCRSESCPRPARWWSDSRWPRLAAKLVHQGDRPPEGPREAIPLAGKDDFGPQDPAEQRIG